jgi:hypothetical protein
MGRASGWHKGCNAWRYPSNLNTKRTAKPLPNARILFMARTAIALLSS